MDCRLQVLFSGTLLPAVMKRGGKNPMAPSPFLTLHRTQIRLLILSVLHHRRPFVTLIDFIRK